MVAPGHHSQEEHGPLVQPFHVTLGETEARRGKADPETLSNLQKHVCGPKACCLDSNPPPSPCSQPWLHVSSCAP